MKVLFLDDEKSRVDSFIERTGSDVDWVSTRESFVQAINSGKKYDLIMLDHDLGLPDFCGSDAARYLAENRLIVGDNQRVVIHSANSVGVANMVSHMKYADHLLVDVVSFAWFRCRKNPENNGIQFGYPEEF